MFPSVWSSFLVLFFLPVSLTLLSESVSLPPFSSSISLFSLFFHLFLFPVFFFDLFFVSLSSSSFFICFSFSSFFFFFLSLRLSVSLCLPPFFVCFLRSLSSSALLSSVPSSVSLLHKPSILLFISSVPFLPSSSNILPPPRIIMQIARAFHDAARASFCFSSTAGFSFFTQY